MDLQVIRRARWSPGAQRLPWLMPLVALVLAAPPLSPARAENPQPAPTRTAGPSYRGPILAIGDSVMLGAQGCLEKLGYEVDAQGNRRMSAGIEVLRSRQAPARVVVHLGTNGGLQSADLDRLMQALGEDRTVFLVTIQLPDNTSRYTFEARTNAALAHMPHRHAHVYVIDWNALSDRVEGLVGGDHIHLTAKGCTAYAALVDRLARSSTG